MALSVTFRWVDAAQRGKLLGGAEDDREDRDMGYGKNEEDIVGVENYRYDYRSADRLTRGGAIPCRVVVTTVPG